MRSGFRMVRHLPCQRSPRSVWYVISRGADSAIFASLHELVKDGVNGLIFHDAEQLARQLEVC